MGIAIADGLASPTTISPHIAKNIELVLAAIRAHLAMDIAFVSEFLGTHRVFHVVDSGSPHVPLRSGDMLPMTAGYCGRIVSGLLPELIPDTRGVPLAQSIPETHSLPIGAHLSVPIRVGEGQVFGTFCCISHLPQPSLDKRDLELMRTFGAILASELTVDLGVADERRRKAKTLLAALDSGDPQIVFQPIVRLSDMAVVGVEALARFTAEPKRSPDAWFADANDVDMGPDIELLAIRKALIAARALPSDIVLNVNVSPSTLVSADVLGALRGFDHARIVVEITEHVPIDNYAPILEALRPLRSSGIRVAIDDAGAGYSSLRHVLALRPDIIKFDVSLTRGINRDPVREAMLAALAEFAQRTDTRVVAEGVETAEELAVLRKLNIERAQGYRFGRPQSIEELLRALR